MHAVTIVDGALEWREHPDQVAGAGEILAGEAAGVDDHEPGRSVQDAETASGDGDDSGGGGDGGDVGDADGGGD